MNVYENSYRKILEQLESGTVPCEALKSELPCNLVSQKQYNGLNVFLLGMQGYGSKHWLTFNQANKLGGHVKKDAKASMVTFWNIGPEKTIRRQTHRADREVYSLALLQCFQPRTDGRHRREAWPNI